MFPYLTKPVISRILTIVLYVISVILLYYLVFNIILEKELINEKAFLNWDAKHYLLIKNNAYSDGYTVAFFPLFPFLWNFLSLNVTGIVFFNAILFIVGFSVFSELFKLSTREILLLLSVPGLIFMFLPYSESVFFISCLILIAGLKKNKLLLTCTGLFLCSISRPVSVVLIPALILTGILTERDRFEILKRSMLYIFIPAIALIAVAYIQYFSTGKWLSFFEMQYKWDNHLRIPSLPLRSWGGDTIVRLDGSALLAGLISVSAAILWIWKYIKNKPVNVSPDVMLSAFYIGSVSMIVLFYRGGSLPSLNRYIFATPFFMAGLYYFLENTGPDLRKIGYFMILLTLFWLLFNSYVHIQTFLKYLILTIYLSSYFLFNSKKVILKNIAFIFCLLFNICFQLYFYYRFLSEEWVG